MEERIGLEDQKKEELRREANRGKPEENEGVQGSGEDSELQKPASVSSDRTVAGGLLEPAADSDGSSVLTPLAIDDGDAVGQVAP